MQHGNNLIGLENRACISHIDLLPDNSLKQALFIKRCLAGEKQIPLVALDNNEWHSRIVQIFIGTGVEQAVSPLRNFAEAGELGVGPDGDLGLCVRPGLETRLDFDIYRDGSISRFTYGDVIEALDACCGEGLEMAVRCFDPII